MTSSRAILFLAVALLATPARALVPGGGPAKSDCYAQWQVTTRELQANHGRTGVDCQDGDPRCDVDGQQNGTCTLGVSICVFQPAMSGCVPQEVTSVTPSRKTARSAFGRHRCLPRPRRAGRQRWYRSRCAADDAAHAPRGRCA